MMALKERDPNAVAPQRRPKVDSKKDCKKSPKSSLVKNTPVTASELADIYLDHEENETVPIYDSCNDVRKKVKAYVKKSGTSQAAFCRELSEMMPESHVQARQMTNFMKIKGPKAGGHSTPYFPYCDI
ncbi:hypothetical protein BAUCODRAFT_29835 [Baudoinia panamericana UAMH 10762]|uniref:DUF7726 domain-containing protein n=1 Tax=Baudoinia panamericana (strain UAMH 10762) TaxID=717646 RepID=M2NJB4_BAUPA|nr:uncharacterized protein BAUCODRAFT_29835 [Baudoinia panamericana UAMH 10762]EMC99484.1 hypothetical protein BAUCODRAFT_29835 [Baudoinia panamericana UAMH 10762]